MLTPWLQILSGGLLIFMLMSVLWLVQQIRRDASIVDVGWSAGIGILALYFGVTGDLPTWSRWLAPALATVWSTRLAVYLYFNRVHGRDEDGRYQTLRNKWGDRAGVYFFLFFQAQGLLVVLFALPVLAAMHCGRTSPGPLDLLGIAIWLLALSGEALADWQLARFRAVAGHRGLTCRDGLWRYSRHPNYFFEWLHWWTYVLLAIGSPGWWGTFLAPAIMLFFLFKVTGIPATEAQAVASRGDDYRDYQASTSVFVPWLPRRRNAASPNS